MATKLETEAMRALIEQMSPAATANLAEAMRQLEAIHPIIRQAAAVLSPLRRR